MVPVSQSVGVMEFVPDTEQLLTVISPGVIPAEDVDAARKAYSSCASLSCPLCIAFMYLDFASNT